MTVNRSDFQRRFKAEPDSGDRFIGMDTDDGSGDPFITDLAGMAGGLAPLIANEINPILSSRYASLRVGGGGFEPTFVTQGYGFLCYGPTGQILASNYKSTGGRTLAYSTDGGATWTDTGAPSATNVIQFGWLLSDNSILLAGNDNKLYRTTDLGATSTAVINTAQAGWLGQSIVEGTGGVVWCVPYNAPVSGNAPVLKSTDYGVTWTTMATIKCSNVYPAAADVVRHPHGCFLIGTDLYVMTGDNGTEAGFWKLTGSTLTRVTPSIADPDAQQLRAVGAIVRGSYLYWIQDGAGSTAVPKLCKAPTSDITARQIVCDLPSGGWYLAKLSTGVILVAGVIEGGGTEVDSMVRLWAIDNADNVAELYQFHRKDADPIAGNYGSIRSLKVDANDNIAFVAVNSDFGTGTTVIGKYRAGGHTFVHTAPQAIPAISKGRAWSATPTTSGPTTSATSGAPDVLAEMTLTIEAGVAPILIAFGGSFSANTAGAVVGHNLRVNGTNVNGRETQIKASSANYLESVSVTHVWQPPSPGRYVIDVAWFVNNASYVALGRYTERSLCAVEIGY